MERHFFSDGTEINDSNSHYFPRDIKGKDAMAREHYMVMKATHPDCEVRFIPSQSGLSAVVAVNRKGE